MSGITVSVDHVPRTGSRATGTGCTDFEPTHAGRPFAQTAAVHFTEH